jgi:hypothetical protein
MGSSQSMLDRDLRVLNISDWLKPDASEISDAFGCGLTGLVALDLSTRPIVTIGSGCFNDAGSLDELKLSEKTETISPDSFCNLTNLEYLTFPKSLKFISAGCFENCPKLKRIVFKGPTLVDPKAFKRCFHPDLVFDRQWGEAKIHPNSTFPFPFHSGKFDDLGPYFSHKQRFDKEAKCQITGEKFVYGMQIIILPCGHVFSVFGMLDRYDEGHRSCPTCNFVLE